MYTYNIQYNTSFNNTKKYKSNLKKINNTNFMCNATQFRTIHTYVQWKFSKIQPA